MGRDTAAFNEALNQNHTFRPTAGAFQDDHGFQLGIKKASTPKARLPLDPHAVSSVRTSHT